MEEFIEAYQKIYPYTKVENVTDEATRFFKSADTDGSGALDFGEWCAATINKRALLNETNLKSAFAMFDKDGGGSIEASEISAILGRGISKDEAIWADIIKEVDTNGDGKIDFSEFKTMMEKFNSD